MVGDVNDVCVVAERQIEGQRPVALSRYVVAVVVAVVADVATGALPLRFAGC